MSQRSISTLLLLLLLAAGTAFAQGKDWVTLPLGPAQDVVLEASGARTARIPVRYADAASAPATLAVRVFDVSSRDGHGLALADQFVVRFVPATANKEAAIQVSVAPDASEVVPGPYALSLRVAPDFADAAKVQAITVTLTVPAPQLSVEPVVVGRDIGFLWMADTIGQGELRFAEKGGRTPVRDLQVSILRDVTAMGQPDGGQLSVAVDRLVVRPGRSASAPVSLHGEFAPGKATGKIEIASKDLAAPVTTTFEVRTRRSLIWILLLVGLGSAAGYLVRTWLTARKALLEAAATASAVVALVNRELASTADATYRNELQGLLDAVRDPAASQDADKLSKAATTLQEALVAARGRFEQRLAPVVQAAIALHALADRRWQLPPPAQAAIDGLRTRVRELSLALAARDADRAETLLSGKIAAALLATFTEVTRAGTNLARLAAIVVDVAPPLLDDDYRHLSDATAALSKVFPWPAPDRAEASVDQVAGVLGAWTGDGSVVLKLLAGLPALVQPLTLLAKDRLAGAGGDAALDALAASTMDSLQAAALEVQALSAAPDFNGTRARLDGLRGAWQRYLLSKAPNVSQADLEHDLDAHAWTAAIARAKQAMRPASLAMGASPHAIAPGPSAPTPPASPMPAADPPPATMASVLGFQPASLLVGTVQERAALLASARWASGLQSVFLALLFMAGAVFLYADTWVGSAKEMVALFMLAFGLDLTADNVAGAFKKLKMPELG